MSELENRLSAKKQILKGLLKKLNTASEIRERITTPQGLGDLGDPGALPILQRELADPEVGAIAESSIWSIFMRAPTPQIQLDMDRALRLMGNKESWVEAVNVLTDITSGSPEFGQSSQTQ